MSAPRLSVLLASIAAGGPVPGSTAQVAAQSAEPMPPSLRREQPLTCRGGPGLVFDTLASEGTTARLSLVFTANAGPVGLEGQGLEPGQCGWVDRAFAEREPRRIHLAIHSSDTTPRQSMLDSAVYWGFLAYPTDSGYIHAAGYRHWHASSPPAAPSRRSLPLPFDVRYLPLAAMAIGAVIGIPSVVLLGRWSGWRRLAERYPDRNAGRGTPVRSGQLVMNKSLYKMGVRFTMDESHLHLAMSMLARPGHRPFSVPWAEVEAARDEWPWFPFKGEPMVRLTFAAHPDIRILVRMGVGRRIAEASGGRVRIAGIRETVAAGS